MAKLLSDVIAKRHDNLACSQNCKENGKVFNHAPHTCLYFSTNDTKYDSLLKKKVIDYSKYPELPESGNEEDIEKLVNLSLKINDLEDMQAEVEFGCRGQEDLLEFNIALENM